MVEHPRPALEGLPLAGCRVVITRPEGRGSDLVACLESMGAVVRHIPLIRTEPVRDPHPLRQAAEQVWAGHFHWVVVTSPAGAEALAQALEACRPEQPVPLAARICAVGPATRRALESWGLAVSAEPAEARGSAIPEALQRCGPLEGARVLLAVADRADAHLQQELARLGAEPVRVSAYHTVEDPEAAARVAGMLAAGEADVVVVASPSAVAALASALAAQRPEQAQPAAPAGQHRGRPPPAGAVAPPRGVVAAAIGPTTARAAREAGFITEQAAAPTAEGVADAVLRAWKAAERGVGPCALT